jgi:hypothetical protein
MNYLWLDEYCQAKTEAIKELKTEWEQPDTWLAVTWLPLVERLSANQWLSSCCTSESCFSLV